MGCHAPPAAPPRPSSSIPCQTSDQNLIRSRRHLSPSPPSITDVCLLFSPLFFVLLSLRAPASHFYYVPLSAPRWFPTPLALNLQEGRRQEGDPSLLVVLGADLAQVSDRTQPGME